jgi:hypothetical protein
MLIHADKLLFSRSNLPVMHPVSTKDMVSETSSHLLLQPLEKRHARRMRIRVYASVFSSRMKQPDDLYNSVYGSHTTARRSFYRSIPQ